MNPTIDTSRLIRNLRDMEDQPVRKPPAFLADMGDGVNYLFTALLSPLMDGREVRSTQLDMERFTLGDVQALYDLCNEPDALFSARRRLRNLYQVLTGTPPETAAVSFL